MKHLKKFNELFDTEELKDQLEIDQLQGKLDPKNLIKGGNLITFNGDGNEPLEKLFYKLTWKYPLFNICNRDDSNDYAIIVDRESSGVHFVLRNKSHVIVFSIKNISPHKYDILVTFEKMNTEFVEPMTEYHNVGINDIYDIIESDLIPSLKEGGFNDVLDFQKREQSKINFLKN